MRQKGSGVHVPSYPIMHAFIQSPTNSQASSTGKQNRRLSLCTPLPSIHGCRLRHWKKRGKKDPQEKITTLNALLAYVQESTCMCLTIFPSHLPCQLHSSSFIGTVKVKTCVPNTCKTTQLRYKQTNTRARVVDSGFTVNQISDWKQKTVNI